MKDTTTISLDFGDLQVLRAGLHLIPMHTEHVRELDYKLLIAIEKLYLKRVKIEGYPTPKKASNASA